MLLFYVRHGDPIYNPDSLTDLGQKQAEALVSRMKVCNPDKIYASSSNRAILTAKPTAELLHKEIEILDWCNEKYVWRDFAIEDENHYKTWFFYQNSMRDLLNSMEIRNLDKCWYNHSKFYSYPFKKGFIRVHEETEKFMLSLGYMNILVR